MARVLRPFLATILTAGSLTVSHPTLAQDPNLEPLRIVTGLGMTLHPEGAAGSAQTPTEIGASEYGSARADSPGTPGVKPAYSTLTGFDTTPPDFPPRRRATATDAATETDEAAETASAAGLVKGASAATPSRGREQRSNPGSNATTGQSEGADTDRSACPADPYGPPIFDFAKMPASPYDLADDAGHGVTARAFFRQGFLPEAAYHAGAALVDADDPPTDLRAIAGVARLLRNDSPDRAGLFAEPPWCRYQDADLWRTVRRAVTGQTDPVPSTIDDSLQSEIAGYPLPIAAQIRITLAEAALKAGAPETAENLLEPLPSADLTESRGAAVGALKARIADARDRGQRAENYRQRVLSKTDAPDPPIGHTEPVVRAWLALETNKVDTWLDKIDGGDEKARRNARQQLRKSADALDALQYGWRGHDLITKILALKQQLTEPLDRHLAFLEDLRNLRQRSNRAGHDSHPVPPKHVAEWTAESLDALLARDGQDGNLVRQLAAYDRYSVLARPAPTFAELALTASRRFIDHGLLERAIDAARRAQTAAATSLNKQRVAAALRTLVRAHLLADNTGRARRLAGKLSTDDPRNTKLKADIAERSGKPERAARLLGRIEDPSVDVVRRRASLLWLAGDWPGAAQTYGSLLTRLADDGTETARLEGPAFRRVAALHRNGDAPSDVTSAFPSLPRETRAEISNVPRIAAMLVDEPTVADKPATLGLAKRVRRDVDTALTGAETVLDTASNGQEGD